MNRNPTILSVCTKAGLPAARGLHSALLAAHPGLLQRICVLDGAGETTDPVCRDASALFADWSSFLGRAFYYRQDELESYAGILCMREIVRSGSSVILIDPALFQETVAELPAGFLVPPDETAVAAPRSADGIFASCGFPLGTVPVLGSACFSIGSGARSAAFLDWCVQKFEFLFRNAAESKSPWDLGGSDPAPRSFSLLWRDCAQMFISVQTCPFPLREPDAGSTAGYRYDRFNDGTVISPLMRDWYAYDLNLQKRCGGDPFANRTRFTDETFLLGDEQTLPVTPCMEAIYRRRSDLQSVFPDHAGKDRLHFAQWFLSYGVSEARYPQQAGDAVAEKLNAAGRVLPERSFGQKVASHLFGSRAGAKETALVYPGGVNLSGFIRGNFGIGESARILARSFEAAKIPFTVINYEGAREHTYTNTEFNNKITNTFPYNVNVMDMNVEITSFLRDISPDAVRGRYNIGYMAWELPEFPNSWVTAFKPLDEIWTCSDFTSDSLRQKAEIPVITVPHAVTAEAESGIGRADFGLPQDKFIFLMMYDVYSTSARKNPEGAIEAFLKAFGGDDRVRLVIKANAPHGWPEEDSLQQRIRGQNNVILYNRDLSKPRVNTLISCCDAFVSLSRSEGFGLGPAEAMALGKPAVLTNWSGNTQYMRDGACCPVAYRIIENPKNCGPYPKGCHWADPDTDDAARWMKKLVDDPAFCRRIGDAGKKVIETEFSPAAIGELIRARLEKLHLL